MDTANLAAVLREKNVFIEGVGFVGRVGSVDLPEVSFKQEEINGRKIDTALLEPMEAKIEIYEVNEVLWSAFNKRIDELASFVVRESIVNNGVKTPLYFELGGWIDKLKDKSEKPGEGRSVEISLNVQVYKVELNGKVLNDIDIGNYICNIGGKDIYSEIRQHTF